MEVKPEQEEETQQQSEQEEEETQQPRLRKKLFVLNLPWTFKVLDIKNLFGECGIVSSVEVLSLSQPPPFLCMCIVFECNVVGDLESPKLSWDKEKIYYGLT